MLTTLENVDFFRINNGKDTWYDTADGDVWLQEEISHNVTSESIGITVQWYLCLQI